MGKQKKGHNWKARTPKDVCIDRSEESKINVEVDSSDHRQYDDANALVLPAKKRTTKLKGPQPPPVKRLSRKQRKKLEKILEQKEKKTKRGSLLEALKTVQVSKEELSQLQSTTQLHNQAYKRRLDTYSENSTNINALSGSNKKRKNQRMEEENKTESSEESSSDESESETSSGEDEAQVSETKSEENSDQKETVVDMAVDVTKTKDTKDSTTKSKPAATSKPVTHVPIQRDPAIQAERLKLPILGEEQVIMETISDHPVTILCGETGSGKTTQIPQFLYEAGYATGGRMIAVTEPRRVAAISMANRVGKEMNLTQREVSYQIRYEGTVTPGTRIKFLTDGVLLKEVQKDFLLSSYSVVVIDEAHERSMYTDILIGLLSRIVPLRHKKGNPLKMIIMSATLRVEDFTENSVLFKTPPPVVKVDSRQFPVTIHFNKRTPDDYLSEAFKKICKIHRELPEGGILVFVTGQQEVHTLVAKLARFFPYKATKTKQEENKSTTEPRKRKPSTSLPDVNLDAYSILPEDEEAELSDSNRKINPLDIEDGDNYDDNLNTDDENSDDDNELNADISSSNLPLYTLPLYSLLSTKKQQKVFEPPPEGCRLCVIATNVAETSITIPGIRYVVDTGKTKTKFYDKVTGVSAFKVTWTSKASSNQRGGRAGRTGPGHCYRLYSSAVFNDELEQFSFPEIVRRPVDDLVLQMKAMCIDKVTNFPFPTPPSEESMKAAEQLLIALGALKLEKENKSSRITSLGQTMAAFPVSPRYGKMLSLGQQEGLLAYVVTVVAALSVQELLVEAHSEEGDEKGSKQALMQLKRNWAGVGESLLLGDVSVLLHAVGGCEYAGGSEDFCAQHSIRYKAMVEIRKLRKQLTDTVNTVLPHVGLSVDPKLSPPGELQCKLLRQILLAGLGDRVARKLPPGTLGEDGKKLKNAYQCTTTDDCVFIHPGSVLYKQQPQHVIYQSLEETSKLYIKGVSAVDLSWLPVFVPHYCVFSKPQDEPKPTYDPKSGQVVCHMTCTFGAHTWPVPAVELPFPHSLECYKWFAVFLLDGSVCQALTKYKASLLSLPVTMVKSWAKLQPRTECFLRSLTSENVYNEETLKKAWEKNPKYLLSAYRDWLPQALHLQIDSIWPPLQK